MRNKFKYNGDVYDVSLSISNTKYDNKILDYDLDKFTISIRIPYSLTLASVSLSFFNLEKLVTHYEYYMIKNIKYNGSKTILELDYTGLSYVDSPLYNYHKTKKQIINRELNFGKLLE